MKALILGGSGFVGRRLAEILATSGVDTTILNRGVTPVSAPPASSESPRTAPLVVVSYGHVDDLCRALIVMATQPAAVGEIFNVTPGAVTSAAYIDTLAAVTGAEPDVVPVPDEVAEKAEGPLFSRLFTPRHHGMLDVAKLTTLLGFVPAYDLASGHAQTFEWLTRAGILASQAAADPLWGRTFDFAYEAKMAIALRGH